MKKPPFFFVFVVIVLAAGLGVGIWYQDAAVPLLVLRPSEGVPVTTFNLVFRVGSADDPEGAEGLAHLTARLIREGGVKAWNDKPARTRAQLEEFLFPLAADIDVHIEKEQISFRATTASDNALVVFETLSQVILVPAFDEREFERLRAEALDSLTKQLPREDQEELGKAALDQAMYGKTHPYGHDVQGTIRGVKALGLAQVTQFYREHFTQRRLSIGIGGVIARELRAKAAAGFRQLPRGDATSARIPEAIPPAQKRLLLVKGPFDATGVHLGHPLGVRRGQDDFPSLSLMATAFGKHRSFVGRLMKNVREIRGLNYGTYAYVEDFPHGGELLAEPTQAARSRQAFTMWGRPTPQANGCFLLRQLLREVESLHDKGLSKEEFDLGQSHLTGYVPLLATSLERNLGYAIDSAFYGLSGDYLSWLQSGVRKTTWENVNSITRKYVLPKQLVVVVVTPNPSAFRKQISNAKCLIQYGKGITKAKEVANEDAAISEFPVGIDDSHISVVSSESIYE